MKTHLTICNESDYLRAHLTFIAGKPASGNPVYQELKQRVTSVLKKWFARRLPGLSRG
jgi:hypothetical protein